MRSQVDLMNWPRPVADDLGFLARAEPPLSTWMIRLTSFSTAALSEPSDPAAGRLPGRSVVRSRPPASPRQRGNGAAQRVDRDAVLVELEMQVRAGRKPGRADIADDIAGMHLRATVHGRLEAAHMRVGGRPAAAVVDADHVAVALAVADDTRSCRRTRP